MKGSFRKHRRANSMFEYVTVFLVVGLVCWAMGTYVKQGMQGHMRKAGEVFGYGRQ